MRSEMSGVCIIAHAKYETKILEGLQDLSCLQITDISRKLSDDDWAKVMRAHGQEGMDGVGAQIEKTGFLTGFLSSFRKKKIPLLEGLAGVRLVRRMGRADFEESAKETLRRLDSIYKYCRGLEERLKKEEGGIKKLLELKSQILPLSHLNIALHEFGETGRTAVLLGSITKNHLKSFESCEHLYIRRLEERKSDFLVAVAYLKENEQEALGQIERHHFTHMFIPPLKGHTGTPREIIEGLDRKLEKARERRLEVVGEIGRAQEKWGRGLECAHDFLLSEKERIEKGGFGGKTERSVVIEGWAKKIDLEKIRGTVAISSGDSALLLSREPVEGEEVPVVLENRAAKPFEIVTRTYGLPNYYEIDPTPLLAPSFLIFFGLALTDAGYGIALMLASFLLMRRLGSMGGLFMVLLYGGASTLFFGALIGGWLGGAVPLQPFWFDSIKEPILFMELALAIGVVHVSFGIGIRMYAQARKGDYLGAVLDQGVWLGIIWGVLALFLGGMYRNAALEGAGYWIAGSGMLLVVLSQGRRHKNIFKRILVGLVSLYNLVGYTGDILSYTRLLALGIATGIIALAVNSIAGMAYGAGLLGMAASAIIFLAGHSFNIVINTLGAYIHASRLHYVEFFSKFFEGGGKKFEPFRRQGKYTEVLDV